MSEQRTTDWGPLRGQWAALGAEDPATAFADAPPLVVTIVPATLSWIPWRIGSQNIQSQPTAPMMQIVKPSSSHQMNPRSTEAPRLGNWPVFLSLTRKPKTIIPMLWPRELRKYPK